MKILDRYIILSFLKNYLISFLVLVGMYVVLDLIFKLDELTEIKKQTTATGIKLFLMSIGYVADYYLYQVPLYFAHLSGIIPVVAAAFTLVRMMRFNELNALLSAGVPLLRVAMPMVVVAIVLQGLVWVDQELIIPNIISKIIRSADTLAQSEGDYFTIPPMRDESNGKLVAGRYYPTADPPRMEVVDIILQDGDYRPASHLRADVATWDALHKRWNLVNGWVDHNLTPSDTAITVNSDRVSTFQSSITPTEIQLHHSGEYVDLMSTQTINEMLKRPLSYGRADLLRVKHTRVAQFVINIILLLLASACLLTREPQLLKTAASRCVMWCGACMSMVFMGQEMANTPPAFIAATSAQWPALMAWLPIFIYGPLSVWLLDRVKT
ncbi:MAG TPA: LptF/LptG family permease [Tepidisphaeraceae bacterium]|nr:LptF/LptG family permease [Tepidisphaeraceae bacterium]